MARIAVPGGGWIGRVRAANIAAHPRAKLAAVIAEAVKDGARYSGMGHERGAERFGDVSRPSSLGWCSEGRGQ